MPEIHHTGGRTAEVVVYPWSPSAEQLAVIQFIARTNKPGMRISRIAVIGPRDLEPARLMTPSLLSAIWSVERGCLDAFSNDPALGKYEDNGIPVIVVFEDADDFCRLERDAMRATIFADCRDA
jgi:hypothetical protein